MEVHVYYSCDSCNHRAECANSGIGGCCDHKLLVNNSAQLEEWRSMLGTVKMPAGTFDKICNSEDDDDLKI